MLQYWKQVLNFGGKYRRYLNFNIIKYCAQIYILSIFYSFFRFHASTMEVEIFQSQDEIENEQKLNDYMVSA